MAEISKLESMPEELASADKLPYFLKLIGAFLSLPLVGAVLGYMTKNPAVLEEISRQSTLLKTLVGLAILVGGASLVAELSPEQPDSEGI